MPDLIVSLICCILPFILFVAVILVALSFSEEIYRAYWWAKLIRNLFKEIFGKPKPTGTTKTKNTAAKKEENNIDFEDAEYREIKDN